MEVGRRVDRDGKKICKECDRKLGSDEYAALADTIRGRKQSGIRDRRREDDRSLAGWGDIIMQTGRDKPELGAFAVACHDASGDHSSSDVQTPDELYIFLVGAKDAKQAAETVRNFHHWATVLQVLSQEEVRDILDTMRGRKFDLVAAEEKGGA